MDINTLASTKDKAGKNAVLALKKDLMSAIEATDYQIRMKDIDGASNAYAKAVAAPDAVVAAV